MFSLKKALVVGINDYPSCPLNCCVNDAKAVAKLLEKNEDGSNNFSVLIKCNVRSKGNLRELIQKCFSGDEELALFYFSGHGFIDEFGGHIVTPDYDKYDMGVSMNDILNIVNQSKCRSKVVILDCCNSGFLGQTNIIQQTSNICNGVTLMTASGSDEPALESGEHGVFTSLFLNALAGGAADITGNITPGGIYAYIDKSLGPWDQRPVFKTNISRFTSLRKVIPQVSDDILKRAISYFKTPNSELELDPSFEKTNDPEIEHLLIEPYANKKHVEMFEDLQRLEGIGLVTPSNELHMYYAAMHSKSCKLTNLGKHYWHLVNKNRI